MRYFFKAIISVVPVLLLVTSTALTAQQSTGASAEVPRESNMVPGQEVIDSSRVGLGLTSDLKTADKFIMSSEDIRKALLLSCDLAGACTSESNRKTLGERLITLPEYDEQQGLQNTEIILDMKKNHKKAYQGVKK